MHTTTPGGVTRTPSTSAIARYAGALVVLLAAFALILSSVASPASAAVDTFAQCDGTDNVGGLGATCTVTITNNLDLATGVTSSSVVQVECHGAANTALLCVTTPSSSLNLTTTVNQCNGSENGGGARLECHVIVVNNITGSSTSSPASIDQCVGSADGSGVMTCSPLQSTTNADITQCNGSGNGGGATVTCTVTTSTTSPDLPIIINQCNDSANGGGSTVICTSSITNNILPAEETTTTAAATTTTVAATTTTVGATTTPVGTTIPGETTTTAPIAETTQPNNGGAGGPIGGPTTTAQAGAAGGVIALPATGTSSSWLAMVGGALIAVGAIALISRRRTPA